MSDLTTRNGAAAVIVAALLLAPGCAELEDVTPRRLAEARSRWESAGLRDYDLHWHATGPAPGRYRVQVRGGEVTSIRAVGTDDREREVRPAEPGFYSIEGLFQTLEAESAQLLTDRPFGRMEGTAARPVFERHPRLGYPRLYRRNVQGDPDPLTIEVVSLVPVAPEAPAR